MSRSDTVDGKVVIDVWLSEHPFPNYYGQHYLEPIRKVAEDFGKVHPDYQVNITGKKFRSMPDEVARAIERGDPPDVAEYYATSAQLAHDTFTPGGRPFFTSVEKAIGGRGDILGEPVLVDDIEPAARDWFSFDGELLSMPASVTTALFYVNTTLLERAGVPEVPRTWAEVEAACEALAKLDDGPAHAATWPNHGWLYQQALAQQGGLLADNANGRTGRARTVDLASEEMLAWAGWWKRLHENGHHGPTEDWLSAFEAFAGQRVAFTLSSSKLAHEFVQAGKGAGFDVVATRMPFNDDVPCAGNVISGQSLWLADGLAERKKDGALAFMQYLINAPNAAEWHRAIGFIPVTRASHDLLEQGGWFDENPHQRAATDQLRASTRSPATAGALLGDFAGIQFAMSRAMDDVLLHDADARTRFARATGEAQKLLDDHNAACLRPVPRTPSRRDVF